MTTARIKYMAQSCKGVLSIMFSIWVMACAASAQSDLTGSYSAIGDHSGSMTITKKQGRLRIELKGGTSGKDSAAVAADCEAIAEGELHGNVIRAKLVPFEGEVTSLNTRDIERMDSRVLVFFDRDIAAVEGAFAHCGLQNALNGQYKKRR